MCSLEGCGCNNPFPSLLHLPGAWAASPLQRASQGIELGRIWVHQSPLACLKCCPALVMLWPFLPQCGSQGGKWGRAGAEPLLLPVLCLEHIPAGSGVCTIPQPQKQLPCNTGGKWRPGMCNFSPSQPAIAAGSMLWISRTVLQGEFQQHCSVGTSTGN